MIKHDFFRGGISVEEWKQIKINGIVAIEHCVAEFNIIEMNYTPWYKFKVKIFEDTQGRFTGYTNLMLKDETEDKTPYPGVGHGNSISEALEDTINYFMEMIKSREDKDSLDDSDFEDADPYDF